MIMTLHSTVVVMLQRVAVFALALIAIMPDSMARTILVTVLASRAITTRIPIPMALTI